MEDASSVQLKLSKEESSAFFAVFDGHGGPRFAAYCSDHMHKQLLSDPDFGRSHPLTSTYQTCLVCSRTDHLSCPLGKLTQVFASVPTAQIIFLSVLFNYSSEFAALAS